jgi:hypothetical protein
LAFYPPIASLKIPFHQLHHSSTAIRRGFDIKPSLSFIVLCLHSAFYLTNSTSTLSGRSNMFHTILFLASILGSFTLSNAIPAELDGLSLLAQLDSQRIESRASYWKPPLKSNIQFILTGIPDVDDGYIQPNAGIYEVDMFYTPAETIHTMNGLGQKVICYFSAATAENWRDDYSQFQKQDLGLELPDWPGERYLDIRRSNVWNVIKKRIDLAQQKGCNAIEPDNIGNNSFESLFA